MSGLEALKEYCEKCVHRRECWRPCQIVLLAMQSEGKTWTNSLS